MKAPYKIFGETRLVDVKVWYGGGIDLSLDDWDVDLWIEQGEDWYALSSPGLRNKRVRIIERNIWLKSPKVNETP